MASLSTESTAVQCLGSDDRVFCARFRSAFGVTQPHEQTAEPFLLEPQALVIRHSGGNHDVRSKKVDAQIGDSHGAGFVVDLWLVVDSPCA